MTVIDFNAAMQAAKRAGSFEPLPDGEYELVCLEANPVTASTGKPMIKTKWQVESGPHAGSKVWDQYVFSADNDNALSYFFQHMRHFGLDETFFGSIPPGSGLEPVAAALPGRRCRMELGHRMYEGRMRNEVLRVMPPAHPNPTAAASALPGVPAAATFPPAAAPAPVAAPQVPLAVPQVPAAVPQPVVSPVASQPAQVPVAAPQVLTPQPVPAAAVPQPQPQPAPAPPQPIWDGTQWVLPQQASPQPINTPEEPF